MSNFITSLLCVAILAILCPCGVVRAASVRFVPLNEEIAALKIAVKDAKKTTTLKDLTPLKRSTAYPCTIGETPLQLVALDRKAPDGKPESVGIAIPPDIKSPLVLILRDPQHPSGLRAIAIDDSKAAFPWGSIRFFNTTGNPLTIRFGTDLKPLPEGDKLVDIKPDGPARRIGVQVSLENEPDEILYSAVWEYDPQVRKLIFVLPGTNPQTKAVDLKVIPEDQRIKK
ncbi:MAG: hypothetical protein WCP45_11465 [Verrucomicrobiota bacterium]